MKILFVSSGNAGIEGISPIVKAQGDSLIKKNIKVEYFGVTGKGFLSYIKNVLILRKHLKLNNYDILHAHYSLSGWVSVLASGRIPVVLSLMGDDIQGTFSGKNKINLKSRALILTTWFLQPFVSGIISKSSNLEKNVTRKKISFLIPNGVQLEKFQNSMTQCREELGLRDDKKYILFLGNPDDVNKNIKLLKQAVDLLNQRNVEMIDVYNISHDKVVKYLNSVDVFTLCSFGEGSPNVIKEAMACNCPIVTTDVGDVRWVIGDTEGCYISSYEPKQFAKDLSVALIFAEKYGRTKGRERILSLRLDSDSIAERIISVYSDIRKKNI